MKIKKIITIFLIACIIIVGMLVFKYKIFEYAYHRLLLANNPTTLFPCNRFGLEQDLSTIMKNPNNKKISKLIKYLEENNGDIFIREVGSRCPGKFQYYVGFGGDTQRKEIEIILKNQTIEGIPVFLHNR